MKKISLTLLCLLPCLAAATPIEPNCFPGESLFRDQVAVYSLSDSAGFITPVTMPKGYSWGGTLDILSSEKQAITRLHCEDADQFFKIQIGKDSCIIASDTLVDGNHVLVNQENGLHCDAQQVSHLQNKNEDDYQYVIVTSKQS